MQKKGIHWPAFIDAALIYGGALVIVFQVTWMAADPYEPSINLRRLQIAVVGLGLLMNQVGVWHIASHFTSGRKYVALRLEVDNFIKLVRRLNEEVLNGDQESIEKVRVQMQQSVDEMVNLAGKEGRVRAARRERERVPSQGR